MLGRMQVRGRSDETLQQSHEVPAPSSVPSVTRVAEGMAGSSNMLEFEVADVDAEYVRPRSLAPLAIEFVMPPRDLPWGNRSSYFRDPDGNLIDFFSPIR